MQSEPLDARIQVWALPRSLAATNRITFVFSSSGYLDVSVHPVPFHSLCIGLWMTEVCSVRFPHSEISGSKVMCTSPKLFAAYHVFHRLLVPRHPPYALSSITNRMKKRVSLSFDRQVYLPWHMDCETIVLIPLGIKHHRQSGTLWRCAFSSVPMISIFFLIDTCIALQVLVRFSLKFVFFKLVCNYSTNYLVITITSDVLIKIFHLI